MGKFFYDNLHSLKQTLKKLHVSWSFLPGSLDTCISEPVDYFDIGYLAVFLYTYHSYYGLFVRLCQVLKLKSAWYNTFILYLFMRKLLKTEASSRCVANIC